MRTLAIVLLFGGLAAAQAPRTLIPVKVELITRAVSKTPVLIAYDKGLYRKYGLDAMLGLPSGEFPGAIETTGKMENPDISVDGGVPMVTAILANRGPKRLPIAGADRPGRVHHTGPKAR